MSVLRAENFSLKASGADAIYIGNSALSYIPRAVSLAVMLFSIYMLAKMGGVVLNELVSEHGKNATLLQRFLVLGVSLLVLGVFVVAGLGALQIGVQGHAEEGNVILIGWTISILAAVFLFFAVMAFLDANRVQDAVSIDLEARRQGLQNAQFEAWTSISIFTCLALAVASLQLVNRKNVSIIKSGETIKLKNVSSKEAAMIKNSLGPATSQT